MPSLLPKRRYVASRYADRYSTADGSFPPFPTRDDVFQEDLEAAGLVEYYIMHGESCLTRLTWSQRVFKSHQYFAALAQEQFEAEKLARLVRADGAPLIAALIRIAHGTIEPSLALRSRRLAEIAECATANKTVPQYSF
jgi:hypothetical protein